MAGFRDLQYWLKSHLFPGQTDGNRRPDGGTSCYRPIQRKNPEENQRQSYQEPAAQQQIPVAHSGFTDMNPPATGMYTQQDMSSDPYGYGAAQAAQQEYRAAFSGGKSAPEGGNISYMPNAFTPGSGNSYTHVEHVMAVTSLSTCYEAIECMKNGETVIVTMDSIANESESIRCQDMLAGAAFTLGCTVRMLQAGTVVLIASAGVKVLPEQRSRFSAESAPMAAPAAAPREDRQRTRRMSMNAVGWKNAFSEENRGYNPYTGSMPAAAQDYAGYGGYSSRPKENTSYAAAYGNGTYGNAGYGANTNPGYNANTAYGANAAYGTAYSGESMNTGYGAAFAGDGMNTGYGAAYSGNGMNTGYGMNTAYGAYGQGGAEPGFAGNAGYTDNGYGGNGNYMNNPGNTGYVNNPGYGTGYQAPNAGYGY